ncbi:hypothetical protein BJ546DRAFT_183204 [Cryomyces antarcticus]
MTSQFSLMGRRCFSTTRAHQMYKYKLEAALLAKKDLTVAQNIEWNIRNSTLNTATVTSRFEELSQIEKYKKLQRIAMISMRWGCDIRQCIPAQMRPRKLVEESVGSRRRKPTVRWRRATIAKSDVEETSPLDWSLQIILQLNRLSKVTEYQLPLVQSLLLKRYRKRNAGVPGTAAVAEILAFDVKEVLSSVLDNGQLPELERPEQKCDPKKFPTSWEIGNLSGEDRKREGDALFQANRELFFVQRREHTSSQKKYLKERFKMCRLKYGITAAREDERRSERTVEAAQARIKQLEETVEAESRKHEMV